MYQTRFNSCLLSPFATFPAQIVFNCARFHPQPRPAVAQCCLRRHWRLQWRLRAAYVTAVVLLKQTGLGLTSLTTSLSNSHPPFMLNRGLSVSIQTDVLSPSKKIHSPEKGGGGGYKERIENDLSAAGFPLGFSVTARSDPRSHFLCVVPASSSRTCWRQTQTIRGRRLMDCLHGAIKNSLEGPCVVFPRALAETQIRRLGMDNAAVML